jgi:hypothetical protein
VIPKDGQKISVGGGKLAVRDRLTIHFLDGAIGARTVTRDSARPRKGGDVIEVKCSQLGDEVVKHT